MRSNYSIIFLALSILFLSGCGGNDVAVNNAKTGPANASRPNTNNPVAVTTPTPEAKFNDAPTLTPVFKAYCAAMVKKDEAAIRKFYSQGTLKHFREQMKDGGIKSLVKFLEDDRVTNELCEVSNERITGDRAIGKIKTITYPNGYDVLFVKENGEWKLTNIDPKTVKP